MNEVPKSKFLKLPSLRRAILWLLIPFLLFIAYTLWSPSTKITDGRFDLHRNAIWLQHGWLGDDAWFARNNRDKTKFRSDEKINELLDKLQSHHFVYLYPHLCPSSSTGNIASVNPEQTNRFLTLASFSSHDFKVLPWIGGILNVHCYVSSSKWRKNFVNSSVKLLRDYPMLAGLHINIEPLPTGDPNFLLLLEELKAAMPNDKTLSVAAYPPPTFWHPHPDLHWNQEYYLKIAKRADQIVPMMYDTSIRTTKIYQHVIAAWTRQVIYWTHNTKNEILLGVPAYDDASASYHNPKIENIANSIRAINTSLQDDKLPLTYYAGIALYCEWEMTPEKWDTYKREFQKK